MTCPVQQPLRAPTCQSLMCHSTKSVLLAGMRPGLCIMGIPGTNSSVCHIGIHAFSTCKMRKGVWPTAPMHWLWKLIFMVGARAVFEEAWWRLAECSVQDFFKPHAISVIAVSQCQAVASAIAVSSTSTRVELRYLTHGMQ